MVKRAAQIWDELRRREPVRLLLPHAGQHFMGSAGCYSVHDLAATSDAVADALNAAISPHPGYLRLPGLVAGPSGSPGHAVPFLQVPVRASSVRGPIRRIQGLVR